MNKTVPILGKYQIIEEIGRGAHATVYKARDTTLDRIVALKVMRPGLLWDPDAVERFLREAKAAAQLEHPHIVTIYEVGEAEGTYYIAMRYLPGATVDELIERGPLPVEQAVDITRQVAEALGYGHERGFIHRDVKPSNIIVSDDGFATLTDFGLVKALAWASLTSSGGVMGTPGYVAPELWEEKVASPATDVYALGVVLWEMLAGRRLFAGETPAGVMRKHLTATPPSLTEVRAGVPPAVADVVAKALEKAQEDRYQDGTDLARALEHTARKEAITGAPTSTGPRVRAPHVPPQQWRVPRVAVYAGAILVVLVLVVWLAIGGGPGIKGVAATQTAVAHTATVQMAEVASAEAAIAATQTALAQPTATETAAPTATPMLTASPAPTATLTSPTEITIGDYVKVVGAEADQLSYRSGPGLNYARLDFVKDGTILKVLEGPEEADGYMWWRLEDLSDGTQGWSPEDWLVTTAMPTEVPMVAVPAGEFTMGSDHGVERPMHTVFIEVFEIDQFEVTNEQFSRFVEETGYVTDAEKAGDTSWQFYAKDKPKHPVVKVSWNDAKAYCEWLGKRLPTEAEWEKAARGTDGRTYPWGNDWDVNKANTKEAGYRGTTIVGSFADGASPYGVMDMAGNVAEWTSDWFQPYPGYPGGDSEAQYFGGEYRVLRGGGWFSDKELVRTAERSASSVTLANDDVGFRCAR